MFNLSLAVVLRQWEAASILPIPKSSIPLQNSDYRPISTMPVLECVVVKDSIYPSRTPPSGLSLHDQFASQPAVSTVAALKPQQWNQLVGKRLHTITSLLTTHPHVIAYALDFSKAFDSVRHSAVLNTFFRMNFLDNVLKMSTTLSKTFSRTIHTVRASVAKFPSTNFFLQAKFKDLVLDPLLTLWQHRICIRLILATSWWSLLMIRISSYQLPCPVVCCWNCTCRELGDWEHSQTESD